mgnify:CR=1 FL=1
MSEGSVYGPYGSGQGTQQKNQGNMAGKRFH